MGQADGDHQSNGEHHQAQEPEPAAEPMSDTLDRRETAQDPAGFLLEARAGEAPLVEMVSDSGRTSRLPADFRGD